VRAAREAVREPWTQRVARLWQRALQPVPATTRVVPLHDTGRVLGHLELHANGVRGRDADGSVWWAQLSRDEAARLGWPANAQATPNR